MVAAPGFLGRAAALAILMAAVARAAASDSSDGVAAPSDWRSTTESAYTWTPPPPSPGGSSLAAVFTSLPLPMFGAPATPSYLPYGEPYLSADLAWAQPSPRNLQWRPGDFLLDGLRGDRRPTGHPVNAGFYLHTIRFKVRF
jgi:hypothetical protein